MKKEWKKESEKERLSLHRAHFFSFIIAFTTIVHKTQSTIHKEKKGITLAWKLIERSLNLDNAYSGGIIETPFFIGVGVVCWSEW